MSLLPPGLSQVYNGTVTFPRRYKGVCEWFCNEWVGVRRPLPNSPPQATPALLGAASVLCGTDMPGRRCVLPVEQVPVLKAAWERGIQEGRLRVPEGMVSSCSAAYPAPPPRSLSQAS